MHNLVPILFFLWPHHELAAALYCRVLQRVKQTVPQMRKIAAHAIEMLERLLRFATDHLREALDRLSELGPQRWTTATDAIWFNP